MVKQMVLQRNLLSEILFCTAKISIMVGQLLLCCRFSPTSLQLWELFVNVLGAERRQRPWCFTQHAELLLPWVGGGGTLSTSPVPRALGLSSKGRSTVCLFQVLLYKVGSVALLYFHMRAATMFDVSLVCTGYVQTTPVGFFCYNLLQLFVKINVYALILTGTIS